MPKKKARYRQILALRQVKKLKFEEIGRRFGVTRQRAWQIYQRALIQSNSTTTSHSSALI